jgi:hypothetical protein
MRTTWGRFRRRWAGIALAWAGAAGGTYAEGATALYTTLPAEPYSYGDGTGPNGAPDGPIPGFVGPMGAGVSNYDAYGTVDNGQSVNPVFTGWATGVVNYAPANPGLIDASWLYPNSSENAPAPLGPPTGNVYEIVSLGDLSAADIANGLAPGSITLEFNGAIVDGPGPDFAVFGNALVLNGSTMVFAKLAYVEVSSDGGNFTRFPNVDKNGQPATEPDLGYPTTWPYSVADPTLIYNLAGKHENSNGYSWGTPFDLNQLANSPAVLNGTLDLNNIQYVRLVEIPGSGAYTDSLGDPIYDPWLAIGSPGFELQAVGVLNGGAVVAMADFVAPNISSSPGNATVMAGRNAYFSAQADGEPPPSYHWQRLPAGLATWTYLMEGGSYTGTTTPYLTVSGTSTGMSGDELRCEAISSAGSATSAAAKLTVNPAPPVVLGSPTAQDVTVGGFASFTVSASGAESLQWQVSTDGGNSWSNLTDGSLYDGSTQTTLIVTSPTVGMSGELFRCVATNASGTAPSSAALLTVMSSVVFQTQPKSQVVKAGVTVILSAKATGNGAVFYHWQLNGVNIAGATGANLTLKAVKTTAAGNYTVVVSTNTAGDSNTSSVAALQVVAVPKITLQPAAATIEPGGNATLQVAASGGDLSYAWQIGTANVSSNAHAAGANTANLTLMDVPTGMAGSYRVVVSNPAGSVTSKAVKLVVAFTPPKITSQPVAATALPGGNVTFGVAATGDDLSYKWQLGTKNLVDGVQVTGAATANLTLTGATTGMAGSYRVVVSNPGGSATSKAAKLTVK